MLLHTLADTRIDDCLLMLPAHLLKPKDLELLTTLSTAVPTIPVFAKVSTLAGTWAALVKASQRQGVDCARIDCTSEAAFASCAYTDSVLVAASQAVLSVS